MLSVPNPRTIALLLAMIGLAGCSGGVGPDDDAISKAVQLDYLPAWVQLSSLDTTVAENLGTEVEPRVRARFEGEVVLEQPLYKSASTSAPLESLDGKPAGRIDGRNVVAVSTPADTRYRIFGVSEATRRGDGWAIRITLEGRPWAQGGSPLDQFGDRPIIAGSDDEKAAIAAADGKWKAARDAAARAEAERLAKLEAANQAVLALLASGRADVESSDRGKRYAGVAEFTAPTEAGRPFALPILFDGLRYEYGALIKDGKLALADPDGSCNAVLEPADGALTGTSRCSLIPGAVAIHPTTSAELETRFAEADKALLDFFRARVGKRVALSAKNLTFGGVNNYQLSVDAVDGDRIKLTSYDRRGNSGGQSVWRVRNGTVVSETTDSFWWHLQWDSPSQLTGVRWDRPSRPDGLTLKSL